MSTDRPKRDTMSLEEATISNILEIAAIVEVLERKGLCAKNDLHGIIAEFRRKNRRAKIPETVFPQSYLLTETENRIIDEILALLPHDSFEPSLQRSHLNSGVTYLGRQWN
jgi:hypothetical protein